MGKGKKFIDKKKAATFQLLARDTAAGTAFSSGGLDTERVLVRVDNNPYQVPGFGDFDDVNEGLGVSGPDEPDSIFADAPGDTDEDEGFVSGPVPRVGAAAATSSKKGPLPDHVRKEILELGLPDDGYNYLSHLREIRNAGGGAYYFENPKAKLDQLPLDVKAYDASKLRINSEVADDTDKAAVYTVASNTRTIKIHKAVDSDVLRLLEESDMSRFGSDVEDLEEDFVVKANLQEGEEEQEGKVDEEGEDDEVGADQEDGLVKGELVQHQEADATAEMKGYEADDARSAEKPRVHRLLDEQFDLLMLREYDNSSDDEVPFIEERQILNAKLHDALKEFALNEVELQGKYRFPADTNYGHQEKTGGIDPDDTGEVIRRCREYAEKYMNESQEEVVWVEESSDESEAWNCETIVSTYSNLDNHPRIIQDPGNPKKKLPKNFPEDSAAKNNLIALRGKEKLPVDYLPNKRRTTEKVKKSVCFSSEKVVTRPHSEESKEEKKERKAAVKEERREARKAKKELRGLYRRESQRAQKVAAVSRPPSVRIL